MTEESATGNSPRSGSTAHRWAVARGMICAILIMLGIMAITVLVADRFLSWFEGNRGTAVLLETLGAPFLAGYFAGRIWYRDGATTFRRILYSAATILITISLTLLLSFEGKICLLIISPLFILFFMFGESVGAMSKRRKKSRVHMSVAGFLVLLAVQDFASSHQYPARVADVIEIDEAPARVWEHVASYPAILTPPQFWLFRIGLPTPKATTVTAYRQGAGRKCIFSNGVVFDEVMSVYDSCRELTFDITHQPPDPEILGHLTLQRGQFLLEPLDGGRRTRLTGTSWYELHIFPAWYFNMWAEAITSNVHMEAMRHIKALSEHS